MQSSFRACLYFFRSRLSRQIVLWVFASIVSVEVAILIPSYFRREQELLGQLQQVSSEVLASIAPAAGTGMGPTGLLNYATLKLNQEDPTILGIALYQRNGTLEGVVGETPQLAPKGMDTAIEAQTFRSQDGQRYDVAWPAKSLGDRYILVVRHNSSRVQPALYAYVGRIAILVVAISGFVTLVTMWVLGVSIVLPILQLRDDLLAAGEALAQDKPDPGLSCSAINRKDELGEVTRAFHQMFQRVRQEIRDRAQAETALRVEQEKSERLLLNILPHPIAEQLKRNQKVIAHRFDAVTILFADIVGFTEVAARISATELVSILNEIFSAFDRLADRYGLEKIKTIGDAYMVVGGLPNPRPDHADAIAQMALAMQQVIAQFRNDLGNPFQLRIGINTGSIVSGVIGLRKFSYDLWGDAVNVASRMESQGIPGRIQVTETTYACLQNDYQFEKRGAVEVKGRGVMTTYLLLDKQVSSLASR